MMTALLICALGAPEYRMREAAEHVLQHRLTLRTMPTQVFDPEVRARLSRIRGAAVLRAAQSCLPEGCPYWPDVDFTGWEEEAATVPEFVKWDYGSRTAPPSIGYTFRGYRYNTRYAIYEYIRRTGDTEIPRTVLYAAWQKELRTYSDVARASNVFLLFRTAPELLNWRTP